MTAEKRIPSRHRDPWNKGRMIGQKRPLKPKDVWTIRVRLQVEGRKRDLAMFNLAIDIKLRGCNLVRLRGGMPSAETHPTTPLAALIAEERRAWQAYLAADGKAGEGRIRISCAIPKTLPTGLPAAAAAPLRR
jgi:hypothetical protein